MTKAKKTKVVEAEDVVATPAGSKAEKDIAALKGQLHSLNAKYEKVAIAFDDARQEILLLKDRVEELKAWIFEAAKTGQFNYAAAAEMLKR